MKQLSICALLFMPLSAFAADDSENISLSLQTQYVSEYVFRSVTFSGDAAQTSAELSLGDLKAGVWTSFVIGDPDNVFSDEIDLYIGSGWSLSDQVSGEIGATLYHFPDSGGLFNVGSGADDASTVELYGGVDFDFPFSPSFTGYYDLHLKTTTLEGSASYGVEFYDGVTAEFGILAGLVENSEGLDYQYGTFSSKVFFDISDKAGLFAGAHYGVSTEDTFLDTNFDLSDPDTLSDPSQNSAWFSVGLQVSY